MIDLSSVNLPPDRSGVPYPYLKYSAKTGRFTERDGNDITDQFAAIFDVASIKVGWVFYDSPPAVEMVRLNEPFPACPNAGFVRGIKLDVKVLTPLPDKHMEIMQSSKAFRAAVGDVLRQWIDRGRSNDLPIVKLLQTKVSSTPVGDIHQPQFEIEKWVDREVFDKPSTLPQPANDNDPFSHFFK